MKLYGLKNCDTCRKALNSLEAAGHVVDYIDVRADGVTPNDLQRFWDAFGDSLLNTRSTTWRGLDETERAKDPLTLLADHPTLMKRPVIDQDGSLSLGWTKDVQALFA
ncbi:ArsC/Spx/MgsR family protein [Amylibacter sp. IMCC11727]|uniref:ArsC/Spx/MgsR family protein n=1 Tax=Amylibacter sp. IMCC11727 TaxID=3039851 RepID=UPI00244E18A6|nr:ArsC/Spx/MgsR family protein [Amylibacter sp. IMCC11727]WGI20790.1 ArsC/Spx/MgsR family protein [Amylibacter sp. IMCC11727]